MAKKKNHVVSLKSAVAPQDLVEAVNTVNRIFIIKQLLETGMFLGGSAREAAISIDFLSEFHGSALRQAQMHKDAHLIPGLLPKTQATA